MGNAIDDVRESAPLISRSIERFEMEPSIQEFPAQDMPIRPGPRSRSRVRPAEEADIEELLELTRKIIPTTRWASESVDADKFRAKCLRFLAEQGNHQCALLWERIDLPLGQRIQGVMVGQAQEFFWCNRRQAAVIVFAIKPEARGGSGALKMLTAFRLWAEKRGAHEMAIGVGSGDKPKATGAILSRMGFSWVGGNYVFDLASAKPAVAKRRERT